jgi:hypothetical protein
VTGSAWHNPSHHNDCLLARPERCRFCTDTGEDAGLPLARVRDPHDPRGWIRVDEFRRRYTA